MPATIRFHLDENVPLAVAEGLRRRGVGVTTTSQAGLLSVVLGKCRITATCIAASVQMCEAAAVLLS